MEHDAGKMPTLLCTIRKNWIVGVWGTGGERGASEKADRGSSKAGLTESRAGEAFHGLEESEDCYGIGGWPVNAIDA